MSMSILRGMTLKKPSRFANESKEIIERKERKTNLLKRTWIP
jgi:hypothetical protein